VKVAIFANGSRGDIQPYIALALGLRSHGADVHFIAPSEYSSLAREYALNIHPLSGCINEVIQSEEMRSLLEKGSFVKIMRHARHRLEEAAPLWAAEGLDACVGCDFIISGLGGLYLAAALSEKLCIPLVQAFLVPFSPTCTFPGALIPDRFARAGRLFNLFSHHLVRQVMWQTMRKSDALVRDKLHVPSTSFWGPYHKKVMRESRTMYGFSTGLIPHPADWDDKITITGYWFLEEAISWFPSSSLAAFIDRGDKPVYIGFGSMSIRDPAEMGKIIVGAVNACGLRAVVHSSSIGGKMESPHDNIYVADSIPHSWLFPQMAAVVHHGGAGTTGAGLRAGVPSLVVPFFGDQPFWGARLADAALGPKPLPKRRLTQDTLAKALSQTVNTPYFQQNASKMGAVIRGEDGTGVAYEVLRTALANSKR